MPPGRNPWWLQRFEKLAVCSQGPYVEEDDCQPAHNQHHDGDDFQQRKPELQLTIYAYCQHVGPVQYAEGDQTRQPLRSIRRPEPDIHTHGSQLGHRGHDPHEPVRPTRHKPCEGPDEFLRITGKRAGHRPIREQLTQRPHDEENGDAADGIAQQQARTRLVDGAGRAQEQPDADGASERNELNVPVLEAARESF